MSAPSIPTGRIADGRAFTGSIYNPYKMRVFLGSAQSLNNNTFTVVNFDNVSYDTAMGWDSTNHQYTVPVTGYYSVYVNTSFAAPGLWLYFVVACNFRVNGVAQAIAQQNYGTFAALADGNVDQSVNYNCNTSDTQYFVQGDVVDVRAYQQNSAAAASSLATGTASTYFTIHLISV